MTVHNVEFIYYPGVFGNQFLSTRATLEGSWDARGLYSDDWSSVDMQNEESADGGRCFRAQVAIHDNQTGREFRWGVRFHDQDSGESTWAIASEVKSTESRGRYCSFVFQARDRIEEYRLTLHRYLGANKFRKSNGEWGTCFRLWAPNAISVELVFGSLSRLDDPRHAEVTPGVSLARENIAGCYIADNGDGISHVLNAIPMMRLDNGVWETSESQAELQDLSMLQHKLYMYRVKRDDGSVVYRTDLYSRCQAGSGADDPNGSAYDGAASKLAGRISCSVTVDPERVVGPFNVPVWPEPENDYVDVVTFWNDEFGAKPVPRRVQDLIIYELHLGALGFGSDRPGTLADAIALLDYVEALNVNAIELLPLSEFAGGAENWGYATSHYFAIEYGGGGRDQFKHFVKECHRRGIAVIMDVVYNHYDHHADRAQRYFDSSSPERDIYYWYEGNSSDYRHLEHQGWGQLWYRAGYIKNNSTGDAPAYHQEFVRKLFISSAVALLQEFHIDGLRVDQTTSIHQYNRVQANDVEARNVNIFGGKFLREFGRILRLLQPDVILMAEDHSEWDEVTKTVEKDGMGFDARWYSDYYHHLAGDTRSGGKAQLLYSAATTGSQASLRMDHFAGALWATQFQKIVYSESHDEAGNSEGPFSDPTWRKGDEESKRSTSHRTIALAVNDWPLIGETRRYAEARCRFAWGVTVMSAGTPMFLFGEEVGTQKRFKYGQVLGSKEDLHGMRHGGGRDLFNFYSQVNRLRLDHSALRGRNIDIAYQSNQARVIAFKRWDDREAFLIVASIADAPYSGGYGIESDRIEAGRWTEIFNSDSYLFGGDNVGNGGTAIQSSDGRIHLVIPFCGFVVLAHERNP